MLQSIYPKAFRSKWFQTRLQDPEIDWRHPLTQNLYGAWLLGLGAPRNLVSHGRGASAATQGNYGHGTFSASGIPVAAPEFHGPSYNWVNANEGIDLSTPTAFDIERTEPLTIMAFVSPNVVRSGGSTNYTIWANEGDNGPGFTGIRYQLNWFSPVTSQLFTLAAVEPTNVLQCDDFAIGDINNDAHVLGVKYDGSSLVAGCQFYRDGTIESPGTDSDTLSASIVPATIIPAIGRRTIGGTVGQAFKGRIAMVYLWRGRALSNGEMIEVDTNFHEMFVVPAYRRWFVPAPPGPVTPVPLPKAGVYA